MYKSRLFCFNRSHGKAGEKEFSHLNLTLKTVPNLSEHVCQYTAFLELVANTIFTFKQEYLNILCILWITLTWLDQQVFSKYSAVES